MQEAAEAGRRPAQQFVGVDLRRPKGYAVSHPPTAEAASQAQGHAPAPAEGDPCPRCESRDTKFCYYNNYNTSQPRHFCKGCRRYWTKGGTLRNVPVGGGTRKKPSSSSPPASPLSSYAAAAKPKKPYKKKRRVEAPEPPAFHVAAADPAKAVTTTTETTTTATAAAAVTPTTTDGASDVTTELVVPTAEEDSLAHLLQPDDAAAVALGLGLSDLPAGKAGLGLLEPDSFEWPASFDLGSACWGGAGFGDPDPAGLFLNLP